MHEQSFCACHYVLYLLVYSQVVLNSALCVRFSLIPFGLLCVLLGTKELINRQSQDLFVEQRSFGFFELIGNLDNLESWEKFTRAWHIPVRRRWRFSVDR